MWDRNKVILKKGNAAIAEGDYEGFISLCAEDTEWTFVGGTVLKGREAVRQWMKETYIEPPMVTVTNLIAEGDFLVATGEVTVKDRDGKETCNAYCDIWRFRGEEIVGLRAFVI
ncbi:MAG TPA: nuclear transport factor 2 family protein [Chryseolinea sp.]|nr:nuclear transport factor 2 family protein [Chryseolinea sp.]